MTNVLERFLKYVKYDTKADENSNTCPSTNSQIEFGKDLVEELKSIGMSDVTIDENGYIMATLEANTDKEVDTIGFIAHMDTSPDMSGANVNPKIVENYDGKDIVLNEENNIILSPKDSPELLNYIGKNLITTDGTTLLGADDKAGIAEIITAMEYLINNPQIKHGKIRVGFTPDEEIGRGADKFDVEKFGAKYAYTLDGGEIGELEYENFNAAAAVITVKGKNVHPGYAKDKMKNALLIGMELNDMLPKDEIPSKTCDYEGFYHLNDFNGNVEECKMIYIIREFDRNKFEERKELMKSIVEKINEKYGDKTVILDMKDQYYNMKEKVEPVKHIVDIAEEAMKEVGITPKVKPIRGGTDGARLSFMGLPTPNIFAGGHNFHGRYEYIPTFSMEKAVELIVKIIQKYEQK
ncbi:peptidase T [Tepidibacter formicigenes]|jgi:tripeptide aminopeptidase|uniref:Peptidase T n=2 Tax=Tepidibacter TaxID=214904 RepID=A0A1M6MZB4_9FIRM|nr:peptidase T [Tepidibacter formicigenes]SHJ88799.1 tripeptide aminopeptidase [Tepidibacter formicigenes DSM 15518]